MIDIIIAFLAAEGVPALALLCRVRQTGLSGDAGVFAALQSLGHGSALAGLGCLLLVQLLAIGLVMACTVLFFHWKYRKAHSSVDATCETVEKIKSLPLSGLMRELIFHHVIHEFMRCTQARAAAKRRRNSLE